MPETIPDRDPLLIIGSTGPLGRRVISRARETGIPVRALARTPDALAGTDVEIVRGHGPFWYDRIVRPTVLRRVYADKEAQEEVIRTSGLEWTIVRPAVLDDRRPPGPVTAKSELAGGEKMGPLSRDDVARFLIGEALEPDFPDAVVHLYTETR